MNNFLVFALISAMYFGLNEASTCKKTHIVFHNQLTPGSILDIQCRGMGDGRRRSYQLKYNESPYIIPFTDHKWPDETRWSCVLSHGKNLEFYFDLEAYHTKSRR